MKKLNLYLYFLCIAFAPAMASGSDYDVMCSIDVNNPCTGIKEQTECNNKASCVFESFIGCKQCPGGEYKSGSTCISCPEETVTTPSGEKKSYDYTSCQGATSKANCYYNCDKYCKSMKTTNGTWSLDTSQYPSTVKPIAAAYWDDDLVTKCKCKLTCKNANDYCSNDGETPNGYHARGSYSVSQNMVFYKCEPNWKKYTSGTDTGFQYWDISKSPADWSTGYITTCGAGRHLNPKTVKTTPNCDKKYGTCESDIQKCDENFLGNCYVYYTSANMTSQIAVHGSIFTTGKLEWAGDNTTDKWTVSSGECKCKVEEVPIMQRLTQPTRNVEVGKKNVVLSYTGNGRKGAPNNTLWGNAETTVTSCAAGYYANADKTACIPVEDGYYSPAGNLNRMDCKEVPYSGNKDNYYTHSDGARSNAKNCYVNCSERAGVLNDAGGDSLNGEWRWESEPDGKRYAGSSNPSCDDDLRLYCNGNYYGSGTGETRKCNLCSNLTDSIGQPGYWNKSDGGPGGQTQCYAQCSDKMPSATNGEFTADKSMVYYNAITKAKCEYTLVCNEGYYRKNDGKKCNPCPAGSTSDKGADAITQCYMEGGSEGTEFCDNHGCFNLPTDVKIFYVGN